MSLLEDRVYMYYMLNLKFQRHDRAALQTRWWRSRTKCNETIKIEEEKDLKVAAIQVVGCQPKKKKGRTTGSV